LNRSAIKNAQSNGRDPILGEEIGDGEPELFLSASSHPEGLGLV
jgi:hypothetical protein